MFGKIRKRMTYANVLLTLALVFAMTGGAYAAKKYLITSTKQISPSVLKALTGKRGPAGPAGAPGKDGAPGANGKDGLNGANGKDGLAGANGKEGPQGKEGKEGKQGIQGLEGKEGPAGAGSACNSSGECLLPSGATEAGLWKAFGENTQQVNAIVSYPLRLNFTPNENYVVCPFGQCTPTANCPSTEASEPTAEPGQLCIYQKSKANALSTPQTGIGAGTANPTLGFGLQFTAETVKREEKVYEIKSEPAEFEKVVEGRAPSGLQASGTWAVAAP